MHSNYVGVYVPRSKGGRRLCSVEMGCKATKINGEVRLLGNEDPAMEMVREFEEQEHVQKIRTKVCKCLIDK